MGWLEWPSVVVGGVGLWIVGTVVFDAVHWVLHRMLASRSALLRALAWPHGVHHRWLDGELRTNWSLQRANVFCHLVPEYLTQLAFSGALFLALPPAPVWLCIALQTALFAYLLSQRGLDVNHRSVEILDAHRPGWLCPPAYHALHHVHPDSHFSAYTKLVDVVVGGAEQVSGRRFGLVGEGPLPRALETLLSEAGATTRRVAGRGATELADLDVLVLGDARLPAPEWTEAFVSAAGGRLLPPEVWALHDRAADPEARHYLRDPRVGYRVLHTPDPGSMDDAAARAAARRGLRRLRRGAHFVTLSGGLQAWHSRRRFASTEPRPPEGVSRVCSRRAAWVAT